MNARASHGLNLTSAHLLEGVVQVAMSSLRIKHRQQRGNVDVDHVVVDDSIRGPNSAVVTIGAPRLQLWRSTAIFEWSHKARVEYLPAKFGGDPVKHINPSLRNPDVNRELTGVR